MHHIKVRYLLFSTVLLFAAIVQAETVYVIDELKIGLHEERTIDSPIVKLVSSGTSLSVIDRAGELTQVQDNDGIRGWINNKYIVAEKTGKVRIKELENTNKALQQEIESLKAKTTTAPANVSEVQKALEQQLNTERLKVGELQAQLTTLKTNIGKIDDSSKLLEDIKTLKQENQHLIGQLESSGIAVETNSESLLENSLMFNNWKQMLIIFLIVFVIGMAAGAYVLDVNNRRRHGGFRV
jgi:SH3 domain protein